MMRIFVLIGAIQFLAPVLHAEVKCPAEVKLLLSPSTTQTVIASFGFENETSVRVYLFDTDALDLLKHGVIIRVRQGAKNDFTVKVRLPEGNQQVDDSQLGEQFPCEVDRTRAGANVSYTVGRKYKATKLPTTGNDIYRLLNGSQIKLLHEAQVSINWARVKRIADINSTRWETGAQSPSGKLALELWEWSAGKVLELSAKIGSDAGASKYAELERLVTRENLPLGPSQDTKTSMVLETLAAHTSPPR